MARESAAGRREGVGEGDAGGVGDGEAPPAREAVGVGERVGVADCVPLREGVPESVGVTEGVALCDVGTSSPARKKDAPRPHPGAMPCVAVHALAEHPDADHVALPPSATERNCSAPKLAFGGATVLTIVIVLTGSPEERTTAYALAAPGSTAAGTMSAHADKSIVV